MIAAFIIVVSGGDKNLSHRMMAMKILATGKNSNYTNRERLKAKGFA